MTAYQAIATERRTFLAASLLAMCSMRTFAATTASTPTPQVASAQEQVEALVKNFMTRAQAFLPGVAAPRVVVSFTPQLSWIADDGSAIHTVEWSQCPPPMQKFFASLLGEAPSMQPNIFFREVFNAFLVPHEMSHFVDARRGQLLNGGNFYGGEVHANRVAVAFWLGEPGGAERMARLMGVVAEALARMKSPVPQGEDKAVFFNTHYQALLADASKYGWYQFRMFLDAWEQRDGASFDTLVSTPLS